MFLGGVLLLVGLAFRFGKNSRDGEDWTNVYGPHLEAR